MKEKEVKNEQNCEECHHYHHHYSHRGGGDAVYGLGFVGAAIFFIGQAATFGEGFIGFLKAIVWPVYFVYDALKFLIK
jgi:hypothetical protein